MNIIITGASSGIGQVVAEHLSNLGHQVIGTSRYKEGNYRNYELFKLDVTDTLSVDEFINKILKRFVKIDILINNAGYVLSGPIENSSIQEVKQQFDTNYFGVVRMIQKILPHYRANNSGKILNICSLAGQIGMPFQAHYSASKFALEGLVESLRLELSPYNIQICNINLGDFKTHITANRKTSECIGVAYSTTFKRTLEIYEKEEFNGANPQKIAKLIATLLSKKTLKTRYTVGKLSQTSAITFKRIFGAQIFEKVMKWLWKIN